MTENKKKNVRGCVRHVHEKFRDFFLPSTIKCCLKISGRGLFVRESNTSVIVSLLEGGNGTPEKSKR